MKPHQRASQVQISRRAPRLISAYLQSDRQTRPLSEDDIKAFIPPQPLPEAALAAHGA